ncbi:hypothetical protein DERP_013176, partial [Dermatophagoides pteronyssinus]
MNSFVDMLALNVSNLYNQKDVKEFPVLILPNNALVALPLNDVKFCVINRCNNDSFKISIGIGCDDERCKRCIISAIVKPELSSAFCCSEIESFDNDDDEPQQEEE